MSHLNRFLRGIRNPSLIGREINRLYHRRLNLRSYNESGINVFDEDWDNLLILDACRYQMLAEANIDGELESRISRGSKTAEFLRATFDGRNLGDTVYVTANPQLYWRRNEFDTNLHKVVHIWKDDGWDDDFRTVRPETTTEYAKEVAKEYPNKRLVVHYIQPHCPFIGPTGRKYFDTDRLDLWGEFMNGNRNTSDETIQRAFRENLELALPHVKDLLEALQGKSVVTSDHGQMVGDRSSPIPIREYGHPRATYTEELVKVPWLVRDWDERKEIIREEVQDEVTDINETATNQRLQDLGYLE